MDYLKTTLGFRLKKVARYIELYGVERTLIKVMGQYHSARSFERLPESSPGIGSAKHVGIIGCGNFAYTCVAYYLRKCYGDVVRACMDIDPQKAASLHETYGTDYWTVDLERILGDDQIELVYVASNHASHAEYAIELLLAGKDVHLEKPHVVNEGQLERLLDAAGRGEGRIVSVGFNRPGSRFGLEIARACAGQDGPSVINWFVAGHEIDPGHWYFDEEEGGRVLGNLCHWSDFVFQLVGEEQKYPITINPTRARKHDSDVAVTYLFGEGTVAAITFSAKGHTFEGVKERLAIHRGHLLLTMDDFKTLTIEMGEHRRRLVSRYREHGHAQSIASSYERSARGEGIDLGYVRDTAMVFLKTKEALEKEEKVELTR